MPIDDLQRSLHLRRQKNQKVFDNIDRLWRIIEKSPTHQELLNALHPWNDSINLKFDNSLVWFFGCISALFFLFFIATPQHWWGQLCLLIACICLLLMYCSHETSKPLETVIQALEQQVIEKKYQLRLHAFPQSFGRIAQPTLLLAQLKQLVPIFDQGSCSNTIPFYATTIWQDEQGQSHEVLLFQYHYVNELQVRDRDGDRVTVKELHYDLWGFFIFDFEHPYSTFAATTQRKSLPYPYYLSWQTSDLQTNQRIRILGSDQLELAKTLSPSFTLKLANFFANRKGELFVNAEKKVLCFIGPEDLMQISSKAKQIEDISALRGHLRTFKLLHLERLEQDLLDLLT